MRIWDNFRTWRYNIKQEQQLIDIYWNICASASRWFYYILLHWNFKYYRVQIKSVSYWLNWQTINVRSCTAVPRHAFFYWLSHNNLETLDTQLGLAWEPGNDKQTMYFVFVIKTKHKSVSRVNSKITRKEMPKLFSCE